MFDFGMLNNGQLLLCHISLRVTASIAPYRRQVRGCWISVVILRFHFRFEQTWSSEDGIPGHLRCNSCDNLETDGFHTNKFPRRRCRSPLRRPVTSNDEITDPPGCKEFRETRWAKSGGSIQALNTTPMEENRVIYKIMMFLNNNRHRYIHACKIRTAGGGYSRKIRNRLSRWAW
jgi:hypothetical protein